MVNNLNDGLAWGLFPVLFAASGLSLERIGILVQAAALALVAAGTSSGTWLAAAILLGAGTAMVYPILLAAIGDVAHPLWRARSVGFTGSGATAGSPPGPCSQASSPTPTASRPPWPPSPP
jgi:MFS family permease